MWHGVRGTFWVFIGLLNKIVPEKHSKVPNVSKDIKFQAEKFTRHTFGHWVFVEGGRYVWGLLTSEYIIFVRLYESLWSSQFFLLHWKSYRYQRSHCYGFNRKKTYFLWVATIRMLVNNVDEVKITSDNSSSSLRIMPSIVIKDKIKQSSISGS